MKEPNDRETLPHGSRHLAELPRVRRFRLTVAEGPDTGRVWDSDSERCSVGQDALNPLVLTDPTVSRFHCEVAIDEAGVRVKDLSSLNGVVVDGVQVVEAFVRSGSTIRLGSTLLRFEFLKDTQTLELTQADAFGGIRGKSQAMRKVFSLLEKAARTQATVLFEGETGTGKSRAARALHSESSRRDGPFLVVDCASLPSAVLESELFGHEKGAFTGAQSRRPGVFEEASGGTVFLDEIGELPIEFQPKLLHVLENREVRPVGANRYLPVDVRVLTATHRDLRAEVNAGRFRSDLYYRLAVVRVRLPSLREHLEDLPVIAEELLKTMDASPANRARLLAPDFLERLGRQGWPGNVRELRNALERALVFEDDTNAEGESNHELKDEPAPSGQYAEARRRALDAFERKYLQALLDTHGSVTEAAAVANLDRVYFHRLMRKHGVTRPSGGDAPQS